LELLTAATVAALGGVLSGERADACGGGLLAGPAPLDGGAVPPFFTRPS
jgi:hypothetical protein